MVDSPLVSVLVLNYNGLVHLPKCLESLKKQTYPNYQVTLVDNASTDESVVYVRRNFSEVSILQSSKNTGTAGGFNFGAKYAEGKYMLFLANDIEAKPNLIEELVGKIQKDENIAICTGKMMRFDERDVIDYNGFKIDLFAFPYAPGHNEKDQGQGQELVDVVPTGTLLLIKKDIFEEVGGFDDAYFTLGDEIDLWWRIRLLGYRSVINHNAVVYHKAAATLSKEKRSRLRFYSEKNTIRTLLKNYSYFYLVVVMLTYSYLLTGELLFYIFIRKTDMFLSVLKAILWNILNFRGTYKLRLKVQFQRAIPDRNMLNDLLFRSEKLNIFMQFITGKIKFN